MCKNRDINGVLDVKELTPDGQPITGVVASYPGDESDADTVNGYIADALPQWLNNQVYANQVTYFDYCLYHNKCKESGSTILME